MTDYRIDGAVREGVGHVEDAVGGLTGDAKIQARGKLNQAAGALQNAYGKVADNTMDAYGEFEGFVKTRPFAAIGMGVSVGLILGLVFARAGRD